MRSVRYSTLPAFDSSTALRTSVVTVPTFGLGILPDGPEDAAEAADERHHVGRRDRDVEVGEALLDALGEVLGADDVGARLLRLAGGVALGEDGDRDVAAEAVGQRDRAAQLLVGVADVEPGADVHLDRLVELRARDALDRARSPPPASARARGRPALRASSDALAAVPHADHLDAHRAGGAGDDLRRRVEVVRVEVGELLLRDLAQLRLA